MTKCRPFKITKCLILKPVNLRSRGLLHLEYIHLVLLSAWMYTTWKKKSKGRDKKTHSGSLLPSLSFTLTDSSFFLPWRLLPSISIPSPPLSTTPLRPSQVSPSPLSLLRLITGRRPNCFSESWPNFAQISFS
jgi:hypothetical protein